MNSTPDPTVSRTERVFHASVAVLLAGVFVASFWPNDFAHEPTTFSADAGRSMCLLRRLVGVPCLTCGMTRSFWALGRADVAAAVRFHPLGPAVFAIFALVLVRSARIAVAGRTWLRGTARVLVWTIPVLAAATLVIWIVRAIPFFTDGVAAEAWRNSLMGQFIELIK